MLCQKCNFLSFCSLLYCASVRLNYAILDEIVDNSITSDNADELLQFSWIHYCTYVSAVYDEKFHAWPASGQHALSASSIIMLVESTVFPTSAQCRNNVT